MQGKKTTKQHAAWIEKAASSTNRIRPCQVILMGMPRGQVHFGNVKPWDPEFITIIMIHPVLLRDDWVPNPSVGRAGLPKLLLHMIAHASESQLPPTLSSARAILQKADAFENRKWTCNFQCDNDSYYTVIVVGSTVKWSCMMMNFKFRIDFVFALHLHRKIEQSLRQWYCDVRSRLRGCMKIVRWRTANTREVKAIAL